MSQDDMWPEQPPKPPEPPKPAITRVELIDHTTKGQGREFVRYYDNPISFALVLQDNNRTLKIFIKDQDVPMLDRFGA